MRFSTRQEIYCSDPDCVQGHRQNMPVGGFRFSTTGTVTCCESTSLRYATLSSQSDWTCAVCGKIAVVPPSIREDIRNEPERRAVNLKDPWACVYCKGANYESPSIEDGDIDMTNGTQVERECAHCGRRNLLNLYVLVEVTSVEAYTLDDLEDTDDDDDEDDPDTDCRETWTNVIAPTKGHGDGEGSGDGDGFGDGQGEPSAFDIDIEMRGLADRDGDAWGDGYGYGHGEGYGDGDGDGQGDGHGSGSEGADRSNWPSCPYYHEDV